MEMKTVKKVERRSARLYTGWDGIPLDDVIDWLLKTRLELAQGEPHTAMVMSVVDDNEIVLEVSVVKERPETNKEYERRLMAQARSKERKERERREKEEKEIAQLKALAAKYKDVFNG